MLVATGASTRLRGLARKGPQGKNLPSAPALPEAPALATVTAAGPGSVSWDMYAVKHDATCSFIWARWTSNRARGGKEKDSEGKACHGDQACVKGTWERGCRDGE